MHGYEVGARTPPELTQQPSVLICLPDLQIKRVLNLTCISYRRNQELSEATAASCPLKHPEKETRKLSSVQRPVAFASEYRMVILHFVVCVFCFMSGC